MYDKRFCKEPEKIENYDKAKKDNFKGWCCHHRKGADIPREKLKALGMYYNRPASELIFLKRSEHQILHQKGKKFSEEHREALSEAHKGKQFSEEHKNKMSEAKKGKQFSEEHKKKLSEAAKGHPVSEETRNKIGAAKKGTRWFNNGEINKRCFDCPPGFVPGRLKRKFR